MTTTRVILNYPWNNNGLTKAEELDNEEKLNHIIKTVAHKDLRENDAIRDQSLDQLRQWLKQNRDVENVRTDDNFLLRFLRSKKYSIPMAQQLLLKYLNFRKVLGHLSTNLDYLDPALRAIVDSGFMFASPIRDRFGRRVIIGIGQNFHPDVHKSTDICRVQFMTYETLLQDAENQVLGFTHVGDFAGLTQKHISCWEPTDFLRTLKWGEQSIPMRHKVIHIVNVSTTVKWVLDLAKTRVSEKIRKRIKIHLNVDELKTEMEDVSCLPKEMGGVIPAAEMIELWKRELAAKRDVVVALDKMKILNDRQIIGRHTKLDEESVTGSFRKLNFD